MFTNFVLGRFAIQIPQHNTACVRSTGYQIIYKMRATTVNVIMVYVQFIIAKIKSHKKNLQN